MESLTITRNKDLLDLILNPSPTEFVKISHSETCASYLSKCRQNILAEIWGFYRGKINPRFSQWRTAMMEMVECSVVGDKFTSISDEKSDDLAWNLVLYGDRLCVPRPKRQGELFLVFGKRITDPYNSGGGGFCHVLGYIRPYLRELEAIMMAKPPPLLQDVATPSRRTPFAFASRPFSSTVASNDVQRSIIGSLGATLECIQGPPGTGKSTTIFHVVHAALPEGFRAIVTCVQNKALDSIAEKLGPNVDEVPFVVFGRVGRLGDTASRFTLDAQAERSAEVVTVKADLERVRKIHRLLRSRLDRLLGARIPGSRVYRITRRKELGDKVSEVKSFVQDPWRRWWEAHTRSKYDRLVQDIAAWGRKEDALAREAVVQMVVAKDRILLASRVVLSTLDGLASADLDRRDKTIAIVDEAGTVPEYKLPLLVSLGAQAIVAIGDQKQLQPFTHDTQEVQQGFFHRAVGALGDRVPMLKVQYRMHPVICDFVSKHFYARELTTDPRVAQLRQTSRGGIEFRNYSDADAESLDAKKRCNATEVAMVANFLDETLPGLLKAGKTVAVITFYKHQFTCLMEAGERMGYVRTKKEMAELAKKKKTEPTRFKDPNFRIVTVDAAQGSEADVVVLSCVRCNSKRELGFLTNRNRMCVALSRARERLVVIGSRRTLAADPVWKALAEPPC